MLNTQATHNITRFKHLRIRNAMQYSITIVQRLLRLTMAVILLSVDVAQSQVAIAFDTSNQPVAFGVSQIEKALHATKHEVKKINITSGSNNANIVISFSSNHSSVSVQKEGYTIGYKNKVLVIKAVDPAGAMYGAFDVAEQINMGKAWQTVANRQVNPHFTVRALKFNLPWSSYRTGVVMEQHTETCRDLTFWQRYLDQMALNRFNILSLWNVHPFSYMVKPVNFPGANNFSAQEMDEWKHFWTALFRMAKDRGIAPFIVNWNIAVSPEFAKTYHVQERNDTSAIVKRYTREVVTQVINEYPDLAGIGITLADWMSNFKAPGSSLPDMTPKGREDWIEETVIAGIKAANRPVRLLHRSVLSSDPQEMRRVINNASLADTTLVEIKFNWSHGHSTPVLAMTHDSHSGKTDDGYWNPLPNNYRVQWMIRNEDFFILRWGQPGFIRSHIAQNTAPFVNGYFVGSEGYIPAKDFSHIDNAHKTWQYGFEKQWLFYMLWGRLLYHPATPDAVFEAAFNARYGTGSGKTLLEAYSAASRMPLMLASFYAATWDYSLYSEGFLAPFAANAGLHDDVSSFISIDELIDHPTLDPKYISIKDFVQQTYENKLPAGKVSPLALADSLDADSKKVLRLVHQLRRGSSPTLHCELDDLDTWAWLSSYFATKLRAGVALQTWRITHDAAQQQLAVALLTTCRETWKKVSAITSGHYREVPYIDDHSSGGNGYKDARRFSWIKYMPQVERDLLLASALKPVQ